MTLPNTPYAPQTSPTMAELDQTFSAVAALGIVPCTAAGTNLITLSPAANTPTISAYANYLQFSFVAVNTSNGAVTLQVGSLSALPVYAADGTTQLGSGAIQTKDFYVVAFNQALNGGNGGWVVVSASATGMTAGTYNTVTVDISGRVTASAALRSYLAGMTLLNDTNSPSRTLNISAGNATDSTNSVSIVLSSTFNKSIAGSWAVGSGSNGLGTGLTLSSSTWYHTFAIINGGVSDAYFDTSASGLNAPASTTSFRRIGAVLTNNASTSGQIGITPFTQNGDEFIWANTIIEANGATVGTAAVAQTLTGVPPGVKVDALFHVGLVNASSATAALVTGGDESDQAVGNGLRSVVSQVANTRGAVDLIKRTNTSAQIRIRSDTASSAYDIGTYGWLDTRGRFN